MVERPQPVRDLAWDAKRGREFADRTLDLWQEFLERLPALPVSGRWTADEISRGVAIPVPDEPIPDDELFDYLRAMVFERSAYPGHPRFMEIGRAHV